MNLLIKKIDEQHMLQSIKAKHLSNLTDNAIITKDGNLNENKINKKVWILTIPLLSAITGLFIWLIQLWFIETRDTIIFLCYIFPIFVVFLGISILFEKPILSKKEIITKYEQSMNNLQDLKNSITVSGLLTLAHKIKNQGNPYSEVYDLLLDFIYDLEQLQLFITLSNNNILSYKYEDDLFVTYADNEGIVHQDIEVSCSTQYNINAKEDTLSFVEDNGNYEILLSRPYPVNTEM